MLIPLYHRVERSTFWSVDIASFTDQEIAPQWQASLFDVTWVNSETLDRFANEHLAVDSEHHGTQANVNQVQSGEELGIQELDTQESNNEVHLNESQATEVQDRGVETLESQADIINELILLELEDQFRLQQQLDHELSLQQELDNEAHTNEVHLDQVHDGEVYVCPITGQKYFWPIDDIHEYYCSICGYDRLDMSSINEMPVSDPLFNLEPSPSPEKADEPSQEGPSNDALGEREASFTPPITNGPFNRGQSTLNPAAPVYVAARREPEVDEAGSSSFVGAHTIPRARDEQYAPYSLIRDHRHGVSAINFIGPNVVYPRYQQPLARPGMAGAEAFRGPGISVSDREWELVRALRRMHFLDRDIVDRMEREINPRMLTGSETVLIQALSDLGWVPRS